MATYGNQGKMGTANDFLQQLQNLSAKEKQLLSQIFPPLDDQERAALRVLATRYNEDRASRILGADLYKAMNPGHNQDETINITDTIRSLRAWLSSFETTREGRISPLQLSIPNHKDKKGYYLQFIPAEPNSKFFWDPYLRDYDPEKPVLIIYAEPLFHRIDNRAFLRHQDSNFDMKRSIADACPWAKLPTPVPSTNYVGSGDAGAALMLTRWFERRGFSTLHKTARRWANFDLMIGQHVVMLGNPRTIPETRPYFSKYDFNFHVREHEIENLCPKDEDRLPRSVLRKTKPGGQKPRTTDVKIYEDDEDFIDADRSANGVIYRFRTSKESCVTYFCSNHSRFYEAAASALTDDSASQLLWTELGMDPLNDPKPPERFEVLAEAPIANLEEIAPMDAINWLSKRTC